MGWDSLIAPAGRQFCVSKIDARPHGRAGRSRRSEKQGGWLLWLELPSSCRVRRWDLKPGRAAWAVARYGARTLYLGAGLEGCRIKSALNENVIIHAAYNGDVRTGGPADRQPAGEGWVLRTSQQQWLGPVLRTSHACMGWVSSHVSRFPLQAPPPPPAGGGRCLRSAGAAACTVSEEPRRAPCLGVGK
jgi:hypothetical protein